MTIPTNFYPVNATNRTLPPLSGHKASQHREELWGLVSLIRDRGCRSYLEIGCREGDTFRTVADAMPDGSRMVGIDLPDQLWGRPHSLAPLREAVAHAARRHYVNLLLSDSQDEATLGKLVPGERFDAILIDADHRFAGVKRDWELYGPLADKLVAFHDIVGDGQRTRGQVPVEVPRFWRELKQGHDHREIVAEGSVMGIGVVFPSRGG